MQNFTIPQDFISVQNLIKDVKDLVLCKPALLAHNGLQSSIFAIFHEYIEVFF
jgi:hypothetical protein